MVAPSRVRFPGIKPHRKHPQSKVIRKKAEQIELLPKQYSNPSLSWFDMKAGKFLCRLGPFLSCNTFILQYTNSKSNNIFDAS